MLKFIRHLLMIAAFACSTEAFAQQNKCTISGQIIESGSNVVVPFATAQIFDGEQPITGVIADIEGKFTLQIELDKGQESAPRSASFPSAADTMNLQQTLSLHSSCQVSPHRINCLTNSHLTLPSLVASATLPTRSLTHI